MHRPKMRANKVREVSSQLTKHAAEIRFDLRNKIWPEADQRVKDARQRSVPNFCAVNAGCQIGNARARGRKEHLCRVRASRGKNAVVTRERRAHTNRMKKPRAE